jgi:hypothetical protein
VIAAEVVKFEEKGQWWNCICLVLAQEVVKNKLMMDGKGAQLSSFFCEKQACGKVDTMCLNGLGSAYFALILDQCYCLPNKALAKGRF